MKLILWIVIAAVWGTGIWLWGYSRGQDSREDFIQALIEEVKRAGLEIKWLTDTNTMLEQENGRLKRAAERRRGIETDEAGHKEGDPE